MRPLLSLVAIMLACLLCSSASAQCAGGRCQMQPHLAPALPGVQAALHSVVDAQPIRRSAYAVAGTAYRVVARPVRRVARVGVVRRLFRGGCR